MFAIALSGWSAGTLFIVTGRFSANCAFAAGSGPWPNAPKAGCPRRIAEIQASPGSASPAAGGRDPVITPAGRGKLGSSE